MKKRKKKKNMIRSQKLTNRTTNIFCTTIMFHFWFFHCYFKGKYCFSEICIFAVENELNHNHITKSNIIQSENLATKNHNISCTLKNYFRVFAYKTLYLFCKLKTCH